MLRWCKRILLCLTAATVLLLATVPWWLGWVLPVVGKSLGFKYGRYERLGYSRFALHDVKWSEPSVRVTATKIELGTPVVWIWHVVRGTSQPARAGEWKVEILEKEKKTGKRETGLAELHNILRRTSGMLARWFPDVELASGVVAWDDNLIVIDHAIWRERSLVIDQAKYQKWAGRVELGTKGEPLLVTVNLAPQPYKVELAWTNTDMRGNLWAWGQSAAIKAQLAAHRWLPEELELKAGDWRLPAEPFRLQEFYRELNGSADVVWKKNAFSFDVKIAGQPQRTEFPALSVLAQGKGDLDRISIEHLELTAPGVQADLSAPVIMDRRGQLLSGGSRFAVEADLQKLHWEDLQGKLSGNVVIMPSWQGWPKVDFQTTSREVRVRDVEIQALDVRGNLDWPRFRVEQASVVLLQKGEISCRAEGDISRQWLELAELTGHLRSVEVARWLPAGMTFDEGQFQLKLAGSLKNLQHEGQVDVTSLKKAPLKPLAVAVTWKGQGQVLDQVDLKAKASHDELELSGKVGADSAQLNRLRWASGEMLRWELAQPAMISWGQKKSLSLLKLTGAESTVVAEGTWDESATFHFECKNFQGVWLTDWVDADNLKWAIANAGLDCGWKSDGPVQFSLNVMASVLLSGAKRAGVNVLARGDDKGVALEKMEASKDANVFAHAVGKLPIVFHPGAEKKWKVEQSAPFELQAATEPAPEFWQELSKLAGVTVSDPEVAATIKGTWKNPDSVLQVRAKKISAGPERWAQLPSLEDIDIQLTADREKLVLQRGEMKIEGQAIHASGNLPTGAEWWQAAARSPAKIDWKNAQLKIEIPEAELAALSRHVPYLAPQGRLRASMVLEQGGRVVGSVGLEGAATRPLGPLGVLQDVNVELDFSGKKAEVKRIAGSSGGQPVLLSGSIDFSNWQAPRLDLQLRGENLPLARQPELLLRSDLDLKITTADSGVTKVAGKVHLRNSLFLADTRAYFSAGMRGGSKRPPYFSVEQAPFDRWELAVDVDGGRFLRMRTPLFVGIASVRARLSGTLREPRAVGEASVDEGTVLFPFASFQVQQGNVRLLESNPFEPILSVNAQSRRYDYDLKMELTGSVASPRLVFSSSPPLESEKLLLMVMAGQVPQDTVTYSDQQRLARLGAYLGQSIFQKMGGDSGATDRLAITTGEKVSRQGNETYDIEYKLNDRFSLIGEYDEFDDYNAGVKYRFYLGGAKDEKK